MTNQNKLFKSISKLRNLLSEEFFEALYKHWHTLEFSYNCSINDIDSMYMMGGEL